MKVYAKVVGLSNHVEEEVVLDLGGVQVYGFLVCSPRELRLGEICMVLLEPSFIDSMDLRVEPRARTSFRCRGKTFAYEVSGFISGNQLITEFVALRDDDFHELYGYLEGSCVTTTVDRINVTIISPK